MHGRVTARTIPFVQIISTGPEIRFDSNGFFFFCLPSRMPTVYLTLTEKCAQRVSNFPICAGTTGRPFNSLRRAKRDCILFSRRAELLATAPFVQRRTIHRGESYDLLPFRANDASRLHSPINPPHFKYASQAHRGLN